VVFASGFVVRTLKIIFLQACLLLLAACGPRGPRVVQKEGFTLIYDTLDVDVSCLSLAEQLSFVEAVPMEEGYLCSFEQWAKVPTLHGYSFRRYLLKVDRETGQSHIVGFPVKGHSEWTIRERDGVVYMSYPEWCDTMWRFIPERGTWEDATEYRDVVYEDEDYRVYSKGMHFASDHTWFMDKRTGDQYFFPVAAGQVLRFNGNFYFTDLARFRGWPIRRLASYATACLIMRQQSLILTRFASDPPTPRPGNEGVWQHYAFGKEDDGYKGCEYTWPRPDTVFNASFKAQNTLYQIVTDPETTWITHVSGQSLKRIVNLGKQYDAWLIGPDRLCYRDDDDNIGIIELGDTLRFHHLRRR
jgi:hypothetical protein